MGRFPPRWGRSVHAFALPAEGAFELPLGVPLGQLVPLVGLVAALPEAELDLGPSVAEVQAQRDEGEALQGDAGLQPVDLVPVEQQLAPAVGFVGADTVGELVR